MQMLTTKDVAARLNVAEVTVKQWRGAGKGPPFVKLGTAIRYDPQQLDAWIAERGQA